MVWFIILKLAENLKYKEEEEEKDIRRNYIEKKNYSSYILI